MIEPVWGDGTGAPSFAFFLRRVGADATGKRVTQPYPGWHNRTAGATSFAYFAKGGR